MTLSAVPVGAVLALSYILKSSSSFESLQLLQSALMLLSAE